jgi:hypothetical protein
MHMAKVKEMVLSVIVNNNIIQSNLFFELDIGVTARLPHIEVFSKVTNLFFISISTVLYPAFNHPKATE